MCSMKGLERFMEERMVERHQENGLTDDGVLVFIYTSSSGLAYPT
jgi:hypothetical protein